MRRFSVFVWFLMLVLVIAVGPDAFADGEKKGAEEPLIQVALLLDTSNSMDGLINQAKRQLWRFVNELAVGVKDGKNPRIEVALYEYGNNGLSSKNGWVRCVVELTADLDLVAKELFALKTNGGHEFCGTVIKHAVENLKWSKSNDALKVIFIAGNEPFTQGHINYKDSCRAAVEKGIIVNTIFCGNHQEGVRTDWKEGARLGEGQYMNIDQNRVVHIDAPQDKRIAELGRQLNKTYIGFGRQGKERKKLQESMDKKAEKCGAAVAAQRALAKAKPGSYDSSSWDLVDAVTKGKVKLEDLKEEDLPEEMKKMSLEERKAYIQKKAEERKKLQEEIEKLRKERREFVEKKRKELEKEGQQTLGTAMVKALREQAKKKGFEFEEEKK